MSFQNRIVGHLELDPRYLVRHQLNFWIHPKVQQDAVRASLDAIGFVDSVVVNRATNTILNGHLRVALAIEAGLATVPVTLVDVPVEDESLVIATFDRLGLMAPFDHEKVIDLIGELDTAAPEIELSGMLDTWLGEAEKAYAIQEQLRREREGAKVHVGTWRQAVSMDSYLAWLAELEVSTGGGEDAIAEAVLRRLGIPLEAMIRGDE